MVGAGGLEANNCCKQLLTKGDDLLICQRVTTTRRKCYKSSDRSELAIA